MKDPADEITRIAALIRTETRTLEQLTKSGTDPDRLTANLHTLSSTVSMIADLELPQTREMAMVRSLGVFASFVAKITEMAAQEQRRRKRMVERLASDKRVLLSLVGLSGFINIVFGAVIYLQA